MSERITLPARRHAESFVWGYEGHFFRIQIGCELNQLCETGEGAPLEIFVNAERTDSAIDALAGDVAILMSLLLQHGATPAEIGHALRRNPNNSRASLIGALADSLAAFSFTPVELVKVAAE